MGRAVVMLSVSLDGFVEGPDRDISWHHVDEEVHGEFNAVLAAAGAFLSGRVTHELMAGFWPTADADPDSTPAMAQFAAIWRDKPKIVYSRTLQQAGWNTTIVRDVVADDVRALKARTEGDLAVGGARLAESFRRLGLIDEYRLYLNPVVLGAGTPLFPPDERVELRLLETRPFGNGVVLVRYAPVPPAAT